MNADRTTAPGTPAAEEQAPVDGPEQPGAADERSDPAEQPAAAGNEASTDGKAPPDDLEPIPGFEPPVPLTPPDPPELHDPEPEPAWGSARLTVCLFCGEAVVEGARFCERCGQPLFLAPPPSELPVTAEQVVEVPASTCTKCGGRIAPDGYCETCGEPEASERDHWEQDPAAWVAGVCDRGVRHRRNEDAMALAATEPGGSWAAMVVCDGVSTATNSDVASLAAAGAALEALAACQPHGEEPITGSVTERMAAWAARMDVAAERANAAIGDAAEDTGERASPPSCTFVAAVVDGPLVVTGWIGDSRAYWVPDDGKPTQLSVDDSWAQEMIAQGMSRGAAEIAPQAHAITRWLGPDAPDVDAHTDATIPDCDGWVVVCSDGLWNYCSRPEDLAQVLHGVQESGTEEPLVLARGLVEWANAQGGRDNITVALARITPTAAADASPAPPPTDPKESHG